MESPLSYNRLLPAIKSAFGYLSGLSGQKSGESSDDVVTVPPTQGDNSAPDQENDSTVAPPSSKPSENKTSTNPLNLKVYEVEMKRLTEEEIDMYLSVRDLGPLVWRSPIPKGQYPKLKRKMSEDGDFQPRPSTSGVKKYPSANKCAVYASHKRPLRIDERELSWLNFFEKVKRFIVQPEEKVAARAYWESMASTEQRRHIPCSEFEEFRSLHRRPRLRS